MSAAGDICLVEGPGLLRTKHAVASLPKSGRTQLRVMLDELGISPHYTHAGAAHKDAIHFQRLRTSAAANLDRVVFLHRDLRDTGDTDCYQTYRRLGGYAGSISEFLRDPHHGIEKIVRYNLLSVDLATTRSAVMVVSYEDLHADTVKQLCRTASFLDHHVDRDRIGHVAARNTFAEMQARERAGLYSGRYGKLLTPTNSPDPNSFKVRRGRVAGFRDELTPADIRYCTRTMKALEQRWDAATGRDSTTCE